MKTQTSFVVAALLFFLFITPLDCLADNAATSLSRAQQLRDHLSNLSSLRFDFTQTTSGQLSGRTRKASGRATLVKDGQGAKMRWDYFAPDTQVLISDGTTISMYFAKLNQMIITPADSLQQDVTFIFFTGQGNVEDDFLIEETLPAAEAGETQQELNVIHLTPRSTSTQVKNITIYVNGVTEIRRIEIIDTFDTVTQLNFTNITENPQDLEDRKRRNQLFSFLPPEGTEIIRQ